MQIRNLAKILKEIRENHKISQEKLAFAINVSTRMISDIEQHKKIPALPLLVDFAEHFNYELSTIIEWAEIGKITEVK